MAKVLITGGAGFIGHNVALYLAESGFDVVVVDSLERATQFAVDRLNACGIPIVRADVRSFDGYRGFNVVIHAAAYVSVPESVTRPLEYLSVNTLGTAKVAYECSRAGAKLIYISSSAVYGDPVKLPISEDHPVNPISPYGLSKYLGELAVKHFSKVYNLRYTTLRLFNIYGPGQNPAYAGVIANFIERATKDEPLIIYGDGSQTRDFVFVYDVAKVVLGIIERDLFEDEVYNVGTGKPITVKQLAEIVARLLGRTTIEIVYESERPGDIKHSYADTGKLTSKLKISFTPIEIGLKHTIETQSRYRARDKAM